MLAFAIILYDFAKPMGVFPEGFIKSGDIIWELADGQSHVDITGWTYMTVYDILLLDLYNRLKHLGPFF